MYKFIKISSLVLLVSLAFSGFANASTPAQFNLTEGDVIRTSGDPDVYIVSESGYKRLFVNPAIFNLYGHLGWNKVKTVNASTRDAFPTSGLFRNCESGDQKVYGLEVNSEDVATLHWVNLTGSQAVAQDSQFFAKVFCINSAEQSLYSIGSTYTSLAQVPNYARGQVVSTPAPTVFSVKLASNNPASNTVTANAKQFTMLSADVSGGSISTLKVKRVGYSSDSIYSNVWVYLNGKRLTDSKTFSSGLITFNNLDIPSGSNVSVVADLSGSVGEVAQVELYNDNFSLKSNSFSLAGALSGHATVADSGSLTTLVVGQQNAKVGEFKVSVPLNDEDVTLKNLYLQNTGVAKVSNVKLVVDGQTFSGSISDDKKFYFSNLNVVVNDGKTKKFEVFADVDGSAVAGDKVHIRLANVADVYVIGNSYGFGVTITNSYAGSDQVVSGNGVLTVSSVSTVNQSGFWGGTLNDVAKFRFKADDSEGFYIDELHFDSVASLSAGVDTITLTYKDRSGNTRTVSETVDGVGSVSFDTFLSSNRPYVARDSSADITVGFTLSNDEDSTRLANFKLVLDSYEATGESSDEEVSATVNTIAKNGVWSNGSVFSLTASNTALTPSDDVRFTLTARSDDSVAMFSSVSGGLDLTLTYASNSVSFDDVDTTVYVNGVEVDQSFSTLGNSGTYHIVLTDTDNLELSDGDTVNVRLVFDLTDFSYDDGDRFAIEVKNVDSTLKWVDNFDGDNEALVGNTTDLVSGFPTKFTYKDN